MSYNYYLTENTISKLPVILRNYEMNLTGVALILGIYVLLGIYALIILSRYNRRGNSRLITGAEAMTLLLPHSGIMNVSWTAQPRGGAILCHFDERERRIVLTDSVCRERTITSLSSVCRAIVSARLSVYKAYQYIALRELRIITKWLYLISIAAIALSCVSLEFIQYGVVLLSIALLLFIAVLFLRLAIFAIELSISTMAENVIQASGTEEPERIRECRKVLLAIALLEGLWRIF